MKSKVLGMGVVALALAAIGLGAAQAQNLRIGLQDDPDVLDPHRARTYVSRVVFASLCDKLVDIDAQLDFVPQLATGWTWSDDGKTLTFKLREDASFHDGSRFDAKAARANLLRAMTLPESLRKGELGSVAEVDAPNATTLVLKLKQPDATLIAQLSDRAGMMISPQTFDDAAKVGRAPVCSGPYRFVERVQNDRIVLERYPQHHRAADYHFERLTFLPIPDTTVRLANLRAGSLDMIERMNPSDLPQVKSDASVQLKNVAGLGWARVVFNVGNGERAKGPFGTDKRVREAFELAIDRNVINDVVGNGIFTPARQPFSPASPYNDAKKFPVPTRDVAKARALLKQAGYQRVKMELVFGNTTATAAIAEMIQAMVSEAGFDLSLRPTEFAAMQKEATAGNFDVMLINWSGRVDPDGNIYTFMTCKGALNDGRYCNPRVDALLNQARTVADVAARKALYDEAQEIILNDERPIMYLLLPAAAFRRESQDSGVCPLSGRHDPFGEGVSAVVFNMTKADRGPLLSTSPPSENQAYQCEDRRWLRRRAAAA